MFIVRLIIQQQIIQLLMVMLLIQVKVKNLSKYNIIKLKILKTIAAGDNPNIKKISKFSCVEVMTGAIIKKPFNTIIPYEKSKIIPNK